MDLWIQFIEENPNSIYRDEAEANLNELKRKLGGSSPSNTKRNPSVKTDPNTFNVASTISYKNRKKGILLASLPGLLVPGIGHWYAKDYITGGLLTGFRVGGIAVAVPGLIQESPVMIIAGSAIYVFTYIVDVADAPFAVDRYNARLEQIHKSRLSNLGNNENPFRTKSGTYVAMSFYF